MLKAGHLPWSVSQTQDCVKVSVNTPTAKDWDQTFLVRSDVHHDSPDCDRALERRHLDEAVERNAGIIDLGDLFDVMQAPHDPRRSQGGRDKALDTDDYFNDVLDRHMDFYRDYAGRFVMLGLGNHEMAVVGHCGFNLTREIARRFALECGSQCVWSDYCGWIRFQFRWNDHKQQSVTAYYTHGNGGSAPVTKGILHASRRGLVLPDANLVFSGHTHEGWYFPISRWRISQQGVQTEDEQLHIQIPSYKIRPKAKGAWEKQKGFAPQPHGAWWLKFAIRRERIVYNVERAI